MGAFTFLTFLNNLSLLCNNSALLRLTPIQTVTEPGRPSWYPITYTKRKSDTTTPMASKIGNGIAGTEAVKSQIKGRSQDAAHNRLGGRVWRVQIEPPRDMRSRIIRHIPMRSRAYSGKHSRRHHDDLPCGAIIRRRGTEGYSHWMHGITKM